ncbi:DUF3027 domain-containing protein [Agreia sp. PsM10]|uniref:DUF3027 domain-containing protein n=1 Tax=Agreia sp. PsM10 TaxID=3030533 RepID=UPI00263A64FC|nr:DUF3027 domain-containing protein [Agreia sp. PsM10]MDN4641670.1 DUF3027 domain-containing protein [Agreia sp. PsM10]
MQHSDPTPDGSSDAEVEPETEAVEAPVQFEADPVLLAAIDQARAALLEITPATTIGAVVGHTTHDEHVLSLHFASLMPGYPDWHWTATLSRIDGESEPNVLETELLPGEGAVLAPEWTPWSERLEDYKLAQEHAAALAEDDDDEDFDDEADVDSDDEDIDDELDLDDHILDDDVLDDAVHEHAEAAVLDASVLVRGDDAPREAAPEQAVDVDEEGLTVVDLDDSEPRSSVYYDEDAPEDLR